MMKVFLLLATFLPTIGAFQGLTSSSRCPTALAMSDDDFMRWARASRSAQDGDNVVELVRPLGLILKEDEQRNVYVETLAPKGNAARSGKVKEGDIVTMCSATFGNEMWSTRGVGLSRVLAAIRLRAGSTVSLVFETPGEYKKKQALTNKEIQQREEAARAAQAKKDSLLKELENDEKKLNPKKFFGLF
ncbi:hypothetical protein FisN_1Hh713 [Fistulifera solaris]|uniref:PDZ domain-containing protein n=1 Tax=Fistulifera solaris TaxID=1519565 RepID=A0A1Z5JMY4_FISSO|nr:hypothetical protein FisN_1Hh713 [Fistulifera solaris]|eukprot:GAX15276.1 hypothetical protein FisN_1Hh713 [Fistulifera solaris]